MSIVVTKPSFERVGRTTLYWRMQNRPAPRNYKRYTLHAVNSAIELGRLDTLDWGIDADNGWLPTIYVSMPNPKFDVLVQSDHNDGTGEHHVFPAALWTQGTEQTANAIGALFRDIFAVKASFDKAMTTLKNQAPEGFSAGNAPRYADTLQTIGYGVTARRYHREAEIYRHAAQRWEEIRDQIDAIKSEVADVESLSAASGTLTYQIQLYNEMAGACFHFANVSQQAHDIYRNIAAVPHRQPTAAEHRVIDALPRENKIFNNWKYRSTMVSDESMAELTELRQSMLEMPKENPYLDRLFTTIAEAQKKAARPVRLPNGEGLTVPPPANQLGQVLNAVAKLKDSAKITPSGGSGWRDRFRQRQESGATHPVQRG